MAQPSRVRAVAVALLTIFLGVFLTSPASAADEWKWLGTKQISLYQSPRITGVCAGDAQIMAKGQTAVHEGTIKTFDVGANVPKNPETFKNDNQIPYIVSAERSWVVAALWSQNISKVGKDPAFDASLSWAVQSQLAAFKYKNKPKPADGGVEAAKLVERAAAVAGPYQIKIWASVKDGSIRVENIGVRGRSGWIEGLNAELSLAGPVKGDTKYSLKTKSEPISVDVPVTGPGEVQMKVRISGLPANKIQLWEHPVHQDLVAAVPGSTTLESSGSVDIPVAPLALGISTLVKQTVIQTGEIPVDQITVAAEHWPVDAGSNPVVTSIRAELYGPFETAPKQQESIPKGLKPVASTTFSIDSPGVFETPDLELKEALKPGYYTWVVSARAADNKALSIEGRTTAKLTEDVISDFGIPSETFQVQAAKQGAEPTAESSETTATSENTKQTDPSATTEAENTTQIVRKLPETGVTDLIIPALALACMGIGLLMFRHPGKKRTETN